MIVSMHIKLNNFCFFKMAESRSMKIWSVKYIKLFKHEISRKVQGLQRYVGGINSGTWLSTYTGSNQEDRKLSGHD